MMMTRVSGALLVAAVAIAGCSKSKDKGTSTGSAASGTGSDTASDSGSATASDGLAAPTVAVKKIDGPSVTPTVTSSITFVTPKDPSATWAEMAFACYRAAIELEPGNKASSAFTQVSPLVEPALAAAGIDLDHDVAAIGGWDCGGSPCIYFAVTLRHPEKISDMLKTIPGITPIKIADNHYKFDAPGATGPRTIHVRVVPIQWGAAMPTDAWSTEMTKATHLIFLGGVFGKGDVDPLASIADPKAAAAQVRNAEGMLADAHGRCVVGTVGPNDFKPGFHLERGRFAMAAPSGAGDPLTRLIGSTRSLDAEVELTLSPAAKETDVTQWIDESRAWVSSIAEPIRGQFAGAGPMVDAYFDMMGLVASRGFTHTLKDKALQLSWRTDRVKEADISAVEAEFQSVMGASGTP